MTPEAESTAVVVHQGVALGLVRAETPQELVTRATEVATALADVITKQKLFSYIQGKKFVRCEGWTTLAAMLGITPREVSVVEADGTFTATVSLCRLVDGVEVGRASAECGMDESTWASRPRYARHSMALTRATAKSCRLSFSWIMQMAGFQPTPAEEIPENEDTTVEVLTPASDELTKDLFNECLKAGVTKKEFPAFYEKAVGRAWKGMFEEDAAPLRKAIGERKAESGS